MENKGSTRQRMSQIISSPKVCTNSARTAQKINIRKTNFACLFSFHNIINLSRHEEVYLYLFMTCKLFILQKIKFSIKDFVSKSEQIRSFLRIWSYLLKKTLMENFLFMQCHSSNSSNSIVDEDNANVSSQHDEERLSISEKLQKLLPSKTI